MDYGSGVALSFRGRPFFARGNTALSISVTAITTLACMITTPLILSLMISQYLPADFVMPKAQIIKDIGLTLLLPLLAGMIFLHFYPRMAPSLAKWSIRGSLVGILIIVVGSASAGRLNMSVFGYDNMLMVSLFIVFLCFVGFMSAKLMKLSRPDSTAIEFEVLTRNINLGVLINATIFPAAVTATAQMGNTVLFTLLLYGAFQLIISAVLIYIYRRVTPA